MRGYGTKTPERVAEAQRLRAEGRKLKDIAAVLGVKIQTVHAWLQDPDGSAARARKERHRGVCVDCGGPTNAKTHERCRPCARAHLTEAQAAYLAGLTAESRERKDYVAMRWRAGATMKTIAEEMGTTVGTVECWLSRMRAAGEDIPYRYAGMTPEAIEKIRAGVRRREAAKAA